MLHYVVCEYKCVMLRVSNFLIFYPILHNSFTIYCSASKDKTFSQTSTNENIFVYMYVYFCFIGIVSW